MINVEVTTKFGKILEQKGFFNGKLSTIMQASNFIVEAGLKKQLPIDRGARGGMLGAVATVKSGELEYHVHIDSGQLAVTGDSKNYPKYLHEGTGRLRGASDFGYTSGRVRSNDVAEGIGGIRPNRFMDRTAEEQRRPVQVFVDREISKLLRKHG